MATTDKCTGIVPFASSDSPDTRDLMEVTNTRDLMEVSNKRHIIKYTIK